MKVFLLHRDRDFQVKPEFRDPVFEAMLSGDVLAVTNARRQLERQQNAQPRPDLTGTDALLTQDLELRTLWSAMAKGDEFVFEVAKRAVLTSLIEPEAIIYRQRVLADCLTQPDLIEQIYQLSVETLSNERKVFGALWDNAPPDRVLNRSVDVLKLYMASVRQLRKIADEHADSFESEGFTRFFAALHHELPDEYLDSVDHHLRELGFKRGLLESAQLTTGNKGHNYVVRKAQEQTWRKRLSLGSRPRTHSFEIHPRDEAGFRALEAIRGKGLNHVANAVAQSADNVKSFFAMLRIELAFYRGCVNLYRQLEEKGEPTCFPNPASQGATDFACSGLYDVCLSLRLPDRAVSNDINADQKPLTVITGANQGGKSTFLRSVGLAQLMMQAGMVTGASALRANVVTGVFTHYKREEDASMEGGKLDEELSRMSLIADHIKPHALLLCNESFAATNEREGSEIARQIVHALLAKRIKVFFVTHMYNLAHGLEMEGHDGALFLRAEREPDGRRTFRLIEGAPQPTSYGEDSYRRIFGTAPTPTATPAARDGDQNPNVTPSTRATRASHDEDNSRSLRGRPGH